MAALEWASDYNVDDIDEEERNVRQAYIDSITEQIFKRKSIMKDSTRIWEKSRVPFRLSKIHLMANFLIPTKQTFEMEDTITHLTNIGKKQKAKERNRYRMIQQELAEKAVEWLV